MKDSFAVFFAALPRRVKLVLHMVELIICFTAATAFALSLTPLGEFIKPYLEFVAVAFLLVFPIVHVLVEFAFGDTKPPGSDLTDMVSDKVTDALVNVLNTASKITVETDHTKAPDDAKS